MGGGGGGGGGGRGREREHIEHKPNATDRGNMLEAHNSF